VRARARVRINFLEQLPYTEQVSSRSNMCDLHLYDLNIDFLLAHRLIWLSLSIHFELVTTD